MGRQGAGNVTASGAFPPDDGLDRMFTAFDAAGKRAGHEPDFATATAIAAQYGVVIDPPK